MLPSSVFGGPELEEAAMMTTVVIAKAPIAVQNHHFL
jgi:hypothetical protein